MKPENFYNAELDPFNSTYKMLMYREGFSHPNTYYSKKKNFLEPDDKEYLMMSMIERFISKNNCFFRKFEVKNGKTYSPATIIEFWRIFQDDSEERLVLRLFHPTKSKEAFRMFDYLYKNEPVKLKLLKYYELMRVGKTDAIGESKPRKLKDDENNDFFWQKLDSYEDFEKHLAHLYAKYGSRGRIDIYKDAYLKRNFSEFLTFEKQTKCIENSQKSFINNQFVSQDFEKQKSELLNQFLEAKKQKFLEIIRQNDDLHKTLLNHLKAESEKEKPKITTIMAYEGFTKFSTGIFSKELFFEYFQVSFVFFEEISSLMEAIFEEEVSKIKFFFKSKADNLDLIL